MGLILVRSSVAPYTLTAVPNSGIKQGRNRGSGPNYTPSSIVDYPNVAPTRKHHGSCSKTPSFVTQGDNHNITQTQAISTEQLPKWSSHRNTLLGQNTSPPYSLPGQNAPLGSLLSDAKATDDKGTATVSAPIAIKSGCKPNVASTAKHHGSGQQKRAVHFRVTHQHPLQTQLDTDGTITKVKFFNGNILLERHRRSLTVCLDKYARLEVLHPAKATMMKGTATVSASNSTMCCNTNVVQTVSITGSCSKRPVSLR